MNSILTVVTPAGSQDLTTLANVKSELVITGTTEDTKIQAWITQASSVIAAECNRTFGSETDLETFRNRMRIGEYGSFRNAFDVEKITLRRSPVTSFVSVIEDDKTLVENTDFECNYASGILTRLCDDFVRRWCFRKLLITYIAGYELLGTLPHPIERATISLVKVYRSAGTRDPLMTSEEIPGVLKTSYWVGGFRGNNAGALPPDVQDLIAPYRQVDV